MPDIRSFFAPRGGSQTSLNDKAKSTPTLAKKKAAARKRRVVDSDDDDEEPPKKTTPKIPPPKTAAKSAKKEDKLEPTTTSDYFKGNGKNKITRTALVRPKKGKPEVNPEEENYIDDDDDIDLGIFADQFKKPEDDYQEEKQNEEMEDTVPDAEQNDEEKEDKKTKATKPKKTKPTASSIKRKILPSDDEDDEDEEVITKPRRKPTTRAKKRPLPSEDEDEEEEEEVEIEDEKLKPKAKRPVTKKIRAPAPKKKKEEHIEDEEVRKILDSVPTIRAPSPPPRSGEEKKFNFRDFKQRAGPVAQGTVEMPEGEENCLTGLTFVFTGVLGSLSREDGQQLVKKYGGKITGAPSKKTSYVVLGEDAGPKKLETIRQHGLKTIGEEGLFHLIRTLPANGGDHAAAKANEAKKAIEETKIREMAKEMDKATKSKGKEAVLKEADQLWTVKYAPTQINQICGNKGQVERLQKWLRNWPKNLKSGFTKRGEGDGSGVFRVTMIHGPPGIGKTSAAHLVARLEGYDVVETNASDTRSKKLMEETLRGVLDNRSLMGYFAGDKQKVDASKQKLVLIMDEVDGMSAGDRGGVGQLASLCRKTQIPIICICNERKLQKMKPFNNVTFDMQFKRPNVNEVRSRIMSIAYREGIKLPGNVIDQLVEGTHSDIRQIINMLSTYSTTQSSMSFEESKDLAKSWEKHVVLKPWDIAQKLLGTEMFNPNSKKTLNDKIELYFNDHEFSYLMVQENYLKTNPARAGNLRGRERALKLLELADNAAESISDGDLVDALIHGPQQQWSLMPVHGMFSTVKPSSYMYGGYGGSQYSFTQWLGMNSKQGKLGRYVKEIQSHIRLRASGDRHEVRQNYIPTLHNLIVRGLESGGKDAIPDIIQLMDDYFLTKEDWDAIVELGVGPMADSSLNISSQTKSTFTRLYNQMSHPMPFMKATSDFAPKAVKKEVPDIEDAIVESEDEGAIAEGDAEAKKAEDDSMDISKDKYVKIPKKITGKGKGKTSVDEKPKTTRSKPAAKASSSAPTKGRGRTRK